MASALHCEHPYFEDLSGELMAPPTEKSDVHDLLSDPRYVTFRVDQLEGKVERNHDNQNVQRNAMGKRLGSAQEKLEERLRVAEIWIAKNEHVVEDSKSTRAILIRLMFVIAILATSAGVGIGKVLIP